MLAFLQKVVLHRKICIAQSGGPEGLGAARVENREQRSGDANLHAIQQSVFEFEDDRVLFGAGKRGSLQQIEFIGEAEMEVTFGGGVGIVCDERLLSGGGDRTLVLVHEMGGSLESWDDVAPRFADRPGGYTRIVKLGPRLGDAAEMVYLELVDFDPAAAP